MNLPPDATEDVLDWYADGRIQTDRLDAALDAVNARADTTTWHQTLDRLLLGAGIGLLVAGLICFVAANWSNIGVFFRFVLMQGILASTVVVAWRFGLQHRVGRAALIGAALTVGPLFALIGQTYQTGADPYELFLVWSLLILPWVVIGRSPALWFLWLALVNVMAVLWLDAERPAWIWSSEVGWAWMLLAINSAAWVAWELCSRRWDWLRRRWSVRLIATACIVVITALGISGIALQHQASGLGVWVLWVGIILVAHIRYRWDPMIVALTLLSIIVISVTAVMRINDGATGFLIATLVVVAESVIAVRWLQHLIQEKKS